MGIKRIKNILQKDGKAYYDQIVANNEKLRKIDQLERELNQARLEVAASTSFITTNVKCEV
ncbi:hypothetical protein [Bacillus cereus]|nr:hypothetical protein [Bacillus cereus]